MPGPMSTEYREKNRACEKMYRDGVTNTSLLGKLFAVRESTVKRWIVKGKWETREEEIKALDDEITRAADEALLKALKEFKQNPSKDLQSLNSMLKGYLERKKPDKRLLEYIILFCDQYVDFCIQKGYEEHRKTFQETLTEFAEYARVRNSA